ncbi:hypothetical protein [Schaalia hyovaginalis]|uniref:hypothetical protein n=1 Tax=Schaalia hyovaginalis TaxID=29316 RepID=UPI0012B3B035|nr:hypothetical protein [Schaalia hyovaginalis]MCI7670890.1 hypothetical protein [Schaalia hyovaginalis]MDY3093523.1 hypothetical protein [Schaalia hyovaginalis]MST64722.1 hypothetical protein [Schaalia hyovaginalis]
MSAQALRASQAAEDLGDEDLADHRHRVDQGIAQGDARIGAGTVRQQVTVSLISDFNGEGFAPAAHQDGELEALIKAIVERSAVLAPLR